MGVLSSVVSTGGTKYTTAENGIYTCRLKGIDIEKQPKFDDPEVMVDKLKWTFETTQDADDNGNPFRFTQWTGTRFGNDKAGLTILLDSMYGRRLTNEEFNQNAETDFEDLREALWSVMVAEETNSKGNLFNKILKVTPKRRVSSTVATASNRGAAPREEKPVVTDDLDDPFADKQ